MIDERRKADLLDNWWNETNEEDTQEWRDDLTEEEQALVDKWDNCFPY